MKLVYLELRHDFVVAISIIHTDAQKQFNRKKNVLQMRPEVISTYLFQTSPQNSVFILNVSYQENYNFLT